MTKTLTADGVLKWTPEDGPEPPWVEWIWDHEKDVSVCDNGVLHSEAVDPYGFLHGELWYDDRTDIVVAARLWLEVKP